MTCTTPKDLPFCLCLSWIEEGDGRISQLLGRSNSLDRLPARRPPRLPRLPPPLAAGECQPREPRDVWHASSQTASETFNLIEYSAIYSASKVEQRVRMSMKQNPAMDPPSALPLSYAPVLPHQSRWGRGFLSVCATVPLVGLGHWIAGARRRAIAWLIASLLTSMLVLISICSARLQPALLVLAPGYILLFVIRV